MNKRQKFIASCINPSYGGFASETEIKRVKKMARGHYWDEPDYKNYVSYSISGHRMFFEYDLFSWATKKQKNLMRKFARQAALFWSKGKYKKSRSVYKELLKKFD